MASLVLGAVGSYFGGPIGYMIGSALGAALFPPPGQDGPRLSDLKVQNSTYGATIPIVYGTYRVAGNVIWAAQLVEHAHETDSGSGGGGSTTYTYTCSFAVLLCEGPIAGVCRIWADGKLIYDTTVVPPNILFHTGSYELYLGDETQLPDSTIEAHLGIGNVPAYRGQAYWVFADLELGKYGNRLPNLTFEVVVSGTINPKVETFNTPDVSPDNNYAVDFIYNPLVNEIWQANYYPDFGVAGIVRTNAATGAIVGYIATGYFCYAIAYNSFTKQVYAETYSEVVRIDATTGIILGTTGWPSGEVYDMYGINPFNGDFYTLDGVSYGGAGALTAFPPQAWPNTAYVGSMFFDATGKAWDITATYGNSTTLTYGYVREYTASNDAILATHTFKYDYPWIESYAYDPDRNSIWIYCATYSAISPFSQRQMLYEFNLTSKTTSVHDVTAYGGTFNVGIGTRMVYDSSHRLLWLLNGRASLVMAINTSDGSLHDSYDLATYGVFSTDTILVENGTVWLQGGIPGHYLPILIKISPGVLVSEPVTVASIVSDISARSHLDPSAIDVNPLVDMVDGFCIATPMSAQAAIEPLSQSYFFDSVDSEGRVRFVKRGAAPVLTVAATESLLENK